MNKLKQWWMAGVAVTALVGVIGVGAAMAQTPSTTPTTQASPTAVAGAPNTAPATGKAMSNEDATHEAGETPEQEAAEDSGQRHRGGNHISNQDPAHEAAESPERAAQEATNDALITPSAGAPTPGN